MLQVTSSTTESLLKTVRKEKNVVKEAASSTSETIPHMQAEHKSILSSANRIPCTFNELDRRI